MAEDLRVVGAKFDQLEEEVEKMREVIAGVVSPDLESTVRQSMLLGGKFQRAVNELSSHESRVKQTKTQKSLMNPDVTEYEKVEELLGNLRERLSSMLDQFHLIVGDSSSGAGI